MSTSIGIVDTTMRDGNQSLWGATGLTTPDLLAIAPAAERVGFHALDFTSSTHMAVSVRFHQEDPWERIRLLRAAMPTTPLNLITTGMRFISWVPADEELMALVFRCVVRNGIRRFQIVDPANDPGRLLRLAKMARQAGCEEVVIGLTYSISPAHTIQYYAQRASALAGCEEMDRIYLKDPGGLLTTDTVAELAPHFLAAAGGRPAELHSHCTIGLAPQVYMAGAHAGFQVLHTAVGAAARGTSNPAAETTIANLAAEGFSHGLDPEALAEVGAYFDELTREKGLAAGTAQEFDAAYYRHQLPGGMVTTTRRMLEELRRPELFDATLEEVERVRAEMGYPIVVTPVSQLMVTQSVMNVTDKERWRTISDEMLRYFLGHYAAAATAPDPQIEEMVLSRPRAKELSHLEPLSLEGARARFGASISEEELLLRLTMPAEQVDAMLRSPPAMERPPALARPGRDPLVKLLAELQKRKSISYLRLAKGDDLVVWRRAS
jgi:oxaloacetate decarboxylase alpha subunit